MEDANAGAAAWCAEVNSRVHTETQAVPDERVVASLGALRALPSLRPPLRRGEQRKVDRLSTVRFGSARYSVPARLVGQSVSVVASGNRITISTDDDIVAEHALVAPGEASLHDDHYGGPRKPPGRAVRPRTARERAFLDLGGVAEDFLRAAAAAGVARLPSELAGIVDLAAAWDADAVGAALERGLTFRRFNAADIASILAVGTAAPTPVDAGDTLAGDLPAVATRPLSAYALDEVT